MRIALWQTGSADLEQLRERSLAAAEAGARLLITPEAFTTGYAVAGLPEKAQPAGGAWFQEICGIAADAGIAILYGHPEREGAQIFNAATLVDRDGRVLARHHKAHLYGDIDRVYTPGPDVATVAELAGVRIGILICYDVEFPEAVRALALAGAALIAVPTALMRPYEVVARLLVPARAYESQVYVAYANRCGTEGSLVYCGESCVVGLDGKDLVRAGEGDQLIITDIDESVIAASRAEHTYLADRRPELYGDIVR